jgi:hypothetical protein
MVTGDDRSGSAVPSAGSTTGPGARGTQTGGLCLASSSVRTDPALQDLPLALVLGMLMLAVALLGGALHRAVRRF